MQIKKGLKNPCNHHKAKSFLIFELVGRKIGEYTARWRSG